MGLRGSINQAGAAFFALLVLVVSTNCVDPAQRYSPVALSSAVSQVGSDWEKAAKVRDARMLWSLFWDGCLFGCRGFTFQAETSAFGKTALSFRWVPRTRTGSLASDLAGQMASFKKVDKAMVRLEDLTLYGRRLAHGRFRIEIDGVLRNGLPRSDQGEVVLWLERRGISAPWLVTGIDPRGMRTLVGLRPGFVDATESLGLSNVGAAQPTPSSFPDGPLAPGLVSKDFDNDGLSDLFVALPGGGQLLWNRKGSRFEAGSRFTTKRSSLPSSVTAADLDGDKTMELMVSFPTEKSLWLTVRKDGRLVEAGGSLPPPDKREASISTSVLDLDGDGLLDLYVVLPRKAGAWIWRGMKGRRFSSLPIKVPTLDGSKGICALGPAKNPYLAVVGGFGSLLARFTRGRLTKVRDLGRMLGRGCLSADLDGNGTEDLLLLGVASPNAWMIRRTRSASPPRHRRSWLDALARVGRGSLILQGELLLRNPPSLSSLEGKVFPSSTVGWDNAGLATDLDNDGAQEIVMGGGLHAGGAAVCPGPGFWADTVVKSLMSLRWMRAENQPRCRETYNSLRIMWRTPSGDWIDLAYVLGLRISDPVHRLASADLDGDGAVDLIARKADGRISVFRNLLPQKSSVWLDLSGSENNPRSMGALVRVRPEMSGHWLVRRLDALTSPSRDGRIRVGLGRAEMATSVEVTWSDGRKASATHLSAGSWHLLSHPGKGKVLATRPSPMKEEVMGPATLPAEPFQRPDGVKSSLYGLKGKRATFIYLWRPPCATCHEQLETLARWQKEARDVRVLSVHLAAICIKDKKICSIPGLIHLGWPGDRIKELIGGAALPRLLVYDGRARLRKVVLGGVDRTKLDEIAAGL